MPVSPILERQTTYPFVRLNEAARRVEARGIEVIDFGTGDPREPTDPKIRQALVDGLRDRMGYPAAVGLPELREAIAAWAASRFGARLDPDTEIIPTLGSKEAIFTFALAVVDADGARDTVAYTDPGYPVYERGALFAHARPLALPLREEHGFLPDLDAIDDETWARLAVFWINYPNNPTAATAPLAFYERLAALAREHGFVVASDEAYTELWFDEPPASALQLADRTNVVVFNTLSKRSSMTGYRSGFAAGDPELIAALKAFRPTVGTAPQEFVQRASVVAWGDEEHVAETRARYGRKRALFLDLFARKGVRVAGSAATMYIWAEVPEGETSESFAERLLEHGVLVTPGSYLGAAGEGYFRVALVPVRGGVRPRRRDPGARAVTPELALEIVEALDKGERRVASPDGDGWVVDVEAKEAILEYFRLRKVEPMTVGPFSFQDKIPLKVPPNGVRIVPPGVARYGSLPLRGRRADAGLRQHRRLGRAADDGRHLGDGRLVRADRRRRPPRRRRRHRRRARAAERDAGDRRGRRVPRLALHRHRGRPHRRGRGAVGERLPDRQRPDHRRHGRRAGRAPRRRAAARRRRPRHASEGVPRRARISSTAR